MSENSIATRKMKDSGVEWIGEIPEDRRIIRNKYALSFIKGKIPSEINTEQKGIPYIGASDLDTLSGNANYLLYTSDVNVPMCNSEDVLVLWDGARAGLIGKNHTGAISSTIVKITPDQFINKHFFFWYLKGFEKYLYECVNGTTIPHMNKKYVEDIMMIDWSLDDQKRIADFLDDKCGKIDRYIEKQQQIIDKLKEYKQAVITEAVTKGLDPDVPMKDSGIEWIGMIPEHWEVKKFGYIATVKSNLVHPNEYGDYPQVSSENIEKSTGRLLECKTVKDIGVISDNHLFFKGQILYSKIRPALNKACIAPYDGLCSADIYPIETKENTEFVLFSILSESFLEQVRTLTETRVKMPKINQNELSGIISCVPSLDEQNKIVAYINRKMKLIDHVLVKKERILEKLTEYKKSLIYEAVTGKLEV